VPVIAKAGTRKKTTTTPSGSQNSGMRGTRKPVAATAVVQDDGDDDEDEDPLDSYNAVEGNDEDADLPGPPPSSRINKTKPKGKKATAAVTVKQELAEAQSFSDLEDQTPLAKGTTTRASGARKGGRATPATRTPAAEGGGRKTRTKTPATAPASTTFMASDKGKDKETDKENAASVDGEDSEQIQNTQAQGVTVKLRVSRSRGGATAEGTTRKAKIGFGTAATRSASKAVKVEIVEEDAVVVEPVRVRRTRAKTKTG
jgi:hypothetical protein